jgi:hypothetical protein
MGAEMGRLLEMQRRWQACQSCTGVCLAAERDCVRGVVASGRRLWIWGWQGRSCGSAAGLIAWWEGWPGEGGREGKVSRVMRTGLGQLLYEILVGKLFGGVGVLWSWAVGTACPYTARIRVDVPLLEAG